MSRTPGIEPPKNLLKKTLIFLLVLFVIWIIGAIYVLTPRPLTNDTYGYSAQALVIQHFSCL